MRKALVVGGGRGVGLTIVDELLIQGYDFVYIAGIDAPDLTCGIRSTEKDFCKKTQYIPLNISVDDDLQLLENIKDIDTLICTVGFGRVALFQELTEYEINKLVECNLIGIMRVIKKFYNKLYSHEDFYCAVMCSIAGHVASPMFSVYSAAKAGLCRFIENLNAELCHDGYQNRILDISPGSLKGTSFNGGKSDLTLLGDLPAEIIAKMFTRETLYIPQYEEIYKGVLERYHSDPIQYGVDSYEYKLKNNRISNNPKIVVGYLSGTFDLFHIGHLNLLRRAKEQCDYLIVGVHKSGAWKGKETFIPFEERLQIVKSICYVNKAVESYAEDSDAYAAFHYDKLFVGSDYKGSERFKRYETYFQDKGVEIVYFPYTKGTSSTQLREALNATKK